MKYLLMLLLSVPPLQGADPVDTLATDALKSFNVPGVTVVIVKDGVLHHVQAYGLRELGKPDMLTPDDVFPLASCTKAFTAALCLQLDILDDPVRKHLPDFHVSDPNADALVTIRDLLTHRTGVGGYDLLWYHAPWNQADSIKRIAKLPTTGGFREAFQYSTLQYMAAGQAVTAAGKQPWEQLVRSKFTDRLGMKSVTFTTTDAEFVKAPKATGHSTLTANTLQTMPRYEIREPNPAGSINLVPRDIAPWLLWHLDEARDPQRAELHRPQMVMLPPPKAYFPHTTQMSYALGWIVHDYRGRRVLTHGGIIDGFRNQITLLPAEKIGIAVFCNRQDTKLPQALTNAIADHLLGVAPIPWSELFAKAAEAERVAADTALQVLRATIPQRAALKFKPDAYAGVYENAAYGIATVKVADGKLTWAWSSFESGLEYWGDDGFTVMASLAKDRPVQFKSDGAAVTGYVFEGMVFQKK